MIRCVIVDDEQHAIEVLKAHLARVPGLQLDFETTNPIEGLQYARQYTPDLIFLDIQMPELNGMQFLNLLGEKSRVILTTAYHEHALEGYEHNILDYLLKPVMFERFLKAVQKITDPGLSTKPLNVRPPEHKEFLFVKTGIRNKIVKVELSKVVYIESQGNYISFVTDAEKITTLLTLKEIEQQLPESLFIRIHQSYIVATGAVSSIEGNTAILGKIKLPIGETYRKTLTEYFDKYVVNKKGLF
jgi:DNA-binding LytR/AlgR family response regulator